MEIQFTEEEDRIFKRISSAARTLNVRAYLIGGFVRDKILGRSTKDADIVCDGDGIELAVRSAAQFDNEPRVNVFKNFGTAQIRLSLNNDGLRTNTVTDADEQQADFFELEFVGARKESYSMETRKPNVSQGTLEEDTMRRDFTINTLALSLNEDDYKTLHDPLKGLADIENKILRTPLAPDQTFSDDPLRMMRAVRFASQLMFTVEEKTLEAIRLNAGRIEIVSGERITAELNKIVLSPKPSIGFDLLFKTGLLQYIFPQMVALAGAEYIEGKGHKDNFYHTLQVLDNISNNTTSLWLRWAAILHDIAKPVTKKFEQGHGWTFHGHEVVGGRMVPKIFAQLKLPLGEKMKYVRKIVELHLRPISLTNENITDSAIRRLLVDAGDDIEDLMTLCRADITSKNNQKVKRYLANFEMVSERLMEVEESDQLRNWQPPITGEIIMEELKLQPSRMVGDIKNAVREAILEGNIPNEYSAAHAYMLQVASEMGVKNS